MKKDNLNYIAKISKENDDKISKIAKGYDNTLSIIYNEVSIDRVQIS